MATFLISGAGSGIGRATAVRLAKEGHATVLVGRTKTKLETVRAELNSPERHQILTADIADRTSLATGLGELQLNSLAGVISNAGIGGENNYGDNDRWLEILNINLTGTYYLVNECLPFLRKDTSAYKHIIIVSSVLARLGIPRYSAYCASKAGLLGLMRSWAAEFARRKILVNAICPGWVETDMARDGIRALAEVTEKEYDTAYREQMAHVPLAKMSQPEEVASLVAYLISQEQTSFTGQVFDINNGAVMAP